MGVLDDLVKEYDKLCNERFTAEEKYIKESVRATKYFDLLHRLETYITTLNEQTLKAKEGIIRAPFWDALDNVLLLQKEIQKILEE